MCWWEGTTRGSFRPVFWFGTARRRILPRGSGTRTTVGADFGACLFLFGAVLVLFVGLVWFVCWLGLALFVSCFLACSKVRALGWECVQFTWSTRPQGEPPHKEHPVSYSHPLPFA